MITLMAPSSRGFLSLMGRSAATSLRMMSSSPVLYPKAAFMVIGDEVLKGSTQDTNTPWLASKLYSRGVDLVRVEVVRDNMDEIGESLGRLRGLVGDGGFVFTSGGIGPTHDDITYQAIAKASGRRLEVHADTHERMKVFYAKKGQELNEGRMRMATLPTESEVLFTKGIWVPLVNCDGTYILPGIPRLFQMMIQGNEDRFTGPEKYSAQVFSLAMEGDFAGPLTEIARKHPEVSIGSYPRTSSPSTPSEYNVKVSIDGRDKAKVEEAVGQVSGILEVVRTSRSWEQ